VPRSHDHLFECRLVWTGGSHGPTAAYDGYDRGYRVDVEGKPPLHGSAAPAFRGDGALHNPEDLLMAALSACHCLSYLALAARAKVLVLGYEDRATGTMSTIDGKIRFREVILHPKVWVARGTDLARARAMHHDAHEECFIASSVNFPVENQPEILERDV